MSGNFLHTLWNKLIIALPGNYRNFYIPQFLFFINQGGIMLSFLLCPVVNIKSAFPWTKLLPFLSFILKVQASDVKQRKRQRHAPSQLTKKKKNRIAESIYSLLLLVNIFLHPILYVIF